MAQLDGVIKTGNYNAILQENAVEYYYNAYTTLSSAVYRAKVAGEFVYYSGTAPIGATDIVIVKTSIQIHPTVKWAEYVYAVGSAQQDPFTGAQQSDPVIPTVKLSDPVTSSNLLSGITNFDNSSTSIYEVRVSGSSANSTILGGVELVFV